MLAVFCAALVAAACTVAFADVSVNAYEGDPSGDTHWTSRGGPYTIFESHPAWPHLGVSAAWRLNPLGMPLSIAFWMALLALGWFTLRAFRAARSTKCVAATSGP